LNWWSAADSAASRGAAGSAALHLVSRLQ